MHADANFADQDRAVTGRPDIDATTIRRARLGAHGTVFKDIDYIVDVDFANNNVSLSDAYLQYTGWPLGIRIGHFKTFNSLEELTSSNYITFMERAAFTRAFGLGVRRVGVGAIYDKNEYYTLSAGYYDAYYLQAQKVRRLIAKEFSQAFENCDIILGPTAPTTAFEIGARAEDPVQMYLGDIFTIPAPLAGLPAVSIPCGFDAAGLPVGLQLMGRHFSEGLLLRAAHRYQQATDWHLRVPTETPL